MTNPAATPLSRPEPVHFWQALLFWLKLGFLSFGGPAGQIALMHQELVERRRWISDARFLHALNYCMLLPGPEAQQLATYIGWLLHKTWGGVVAGVLFVLPSLVILIGLSWVYSAYGDLSWVTGILYGIKPAVTAIVLQAAHRIGGRVLKNRYLWAIGSAAFLAIFIWHLPFPLIVLSAALLGWLGGRWAPTAFTASAGHSRNHTSYGPALIDDHTPPPTHAQFSAPRLGLILLTGVLLWLLPMGVLIATQSWYGTFTQMGWFFTKAALLTFGGAYAVLPYVYQGAVSHYGWVSPTQMMDGLALGETTPGPLIMVVAFVAFVGGFGHPVWGESSALASGVVAAVLVTWFTFLPSFIFILAGAPLVEATHGQLGFTAPLTAITAAVVGVITNLALFFAYPVFWPQGLEGAMDGVAAAITLGAAIALLVFKRNVIQVIGVCAGLGLLVKWVV